jgi:hypothetical protein
MRRVSVQLSSGPGHGLVCDARVEIEDAERISEGRLLCSGVASEGDRIAHIGASRGA